MKTEHNQGFIALYRSLLAWEWYGDINTCRVFIHLLLTANYESRKVRGGVVKRGQVSTTVRKLAEETSLTPQKVRTALDHLKSTHEITYSSTPKGIAITVKNYEKFQKATQKSTSNTPLKINTAGNEQHTPRTGCGSTDCQDAVVGDNKPLNKQSTSYQHTTSNKEINIPPISPKGGDYSPAFLEFWTTYPKKVGKGAAWRAFQKVRPDRGLLDLMLKAVQTQKRTPSWKKDGGQFIPNPATWLNQRRWEDEPEEGDIEHDDEREFY